MCKSVYLFLLFVFTGQLLPCYARTTRPLITTVMKTEKKELGRLTSCASPELELVHHQANTGFRIFSAQNTNGVDNSYFFTPRCLQFVSKKFHFSFSASFCKDYINHIYPSHHFW